MLWTNSSFFLLWFRGLARGFCGEKVCGGPLFSNLDTAYSQSISSKQVRHSGKITVFNQKFKILHFFIFDLNSNSKLLLFTTCFKLIGF